MEAEDGWAGEVEGWGCGCRGEVEEEEEEGEGEERGVRMHFLGGWRWVWWFECCVG